jgi:hypothetical protein
LKKVQMQKREHDRKIGGRCEYIEPNIKDSCFLYDGDELVGVYISDVKKMYPKLAKVMAVANAEFLSDNVPKTLLERADVMAKVKAGMSRAEAKKAGTVQYSTIIGSIPPKPLMKRAYPNRSSVHAVKSAQTFIKAMLIAAKEMSVVMGQLLPEHLKSQLEAVSEVDDKWMFGELFTSSISNFNIAAPFHRDTANIKQTLNAIYTHRHNSDGGSLYVPDYDACFEMPTDSLLLYPAWRNVHAVTPIIPTHDGGYRNSLVFYALSGFLK